MSNAPIPRRSDWLPLLYLGGVVAVQAFLFLSSRFRWLDIDQYQGVPVVFALAFTAIALSAFGLWFLVRGVFLRKAQFGLTTLMALVPVVSVPCAWAAHEVRQTQVRGRIFEKLKTFDPRLAQVDRRFDGRDSGRMTNRLTKITPLFGREFFNWIATVNFTVVDEVDEEFRKRPHIGDDDLLFLANTPLLQHFDASHLSLTDRGFASFRSWPDLRTVDIRHTFATNATLAHLGGCRGLSSLYLGGTQVTDEGLVAFRPTSLKNLWLDDTRVSDRGVAALARQRELWRLNLARTAVSDGLEPLTKLSKLAILEPEGTSVGDRGLAHLGRIATLSQLDLRETAITDEGLVHLGKLLLLEELDLSGTRLTGQGLRHLANLSLLRELDLSDTEVTDETLAHVSSMKSLQKLNLNGTQVTSAGMVYLKRLKDLRELRLQYTFVDDAGIAPLQELPAIEALSVDNSAVTDTGRGLMRRKSLRIFVFD